MVAQFRIQTSQVESLDDLPALRTGPALPSNISDFQRLAKQIDEMSAEQRQRIADGRQEDEHFVLRVRRFRE